jgi:hypothetical protein
MRRSDHVVEPVVEPVIERADAPKPKNVQRAIK